MGRPATKSWPREDTENNPGGNEPERPELEPDAVIPPVAEAVRDIQHEPQIPPLKTAPGSKDRGGIISLIIIAILGVIIGFAAVIMM